MKKFVFGLSLCFLLSLIAASTALAAPVPCPVTGTYMDLVNTNAGGGCFIVDKVYSNFGFAGTASGTSVPLTPSQVLYTLLSAAPMLIGFDFSMSLTAVGNGNS